MNFRKFSIYIFCIICSLIFVSCSIIQPNEANKASNEEYIPKEALNKIIKEYVESISSKAYFGGKVFCTYKVIGSEKDGNGIKLYLELLSQEFYVKDHKLTKGAGGDFSAVLRVKRQNEDYKFINCNISRHPEVTESVKIFPKKFREKALNFNFSASDLDKLQKDAETYFKEKKSL